jgi:hypothetical protein
LDRSNGTRDVTLYHTPRAKHVFLLSPANAISVIKEKFYSEIMYAKVFNTLKISC